MGKARSKSSARSSNARASLCLQRAEHQLKRAVDNTRHDAYLEKVEPIAFDTNMTSDFRANLFTVQRPWSGFKAKMCELTHKHNTSDVTVSTITATAKFSCEGGRSDGDVIAIDKIAAADRNPEVQKLNASLFASADQHPRTTGKFNKGTIFSAPDRSFKIFPNMAAHFTGLRSIKGLLRQIEYVRRMLEALTGCRVVAKSLQVQLINTDIDLFTTEETASCTIDRDAAKRLLSSIRGVKDINKDATRVKSRRGGKSGAAPPHPGLRFRLALEGISVLPTDMPPHVVVYESGKVLVMAASFPSIQASYEFLLGFIDTHRAQVVSTKSASEARAIRHRCEAECTADARAALSTLTSELAGARLD
jgi:hypothetical protein